MHSVVHCGQFLNKKVQKFVLSILMKFQTQIVAKILGFKKSSYQNFSIIESAPSLSWSIYFCTFFWSLQNDSNVATELGQTHPVIWNTLA